MINQNYFDNITQVASYLANRTSPHYSRVNYDAFLKEVNFQYKIPSIHITGTNGKGSSATFIQRIYTYNNYRVGLFVSPSLNRFQEMIYINDEEIDENFVLKFINDHLHLFEKYQLTAFEIETFLALSYFNKEKVPLAIIEVGMGGLVDATNIFTPILSIITNVSVEHSSYLGATIEDISLHKAGIIKHKIPVLLGPIFHPSLKVIEDVANEKQAPIHYLQKIENPIGGLKQSFSYRTYQDIKLKMSGFYQINNAALAIEAVTILKKRWPIHENQVRLALYQTLMPGRLEVIKKEPYIILDGAHNPDGVKALINSLFPFIKKKPFILLASFKDKQINEMLDQLAQLSNQITITSFNHPRCRKKEDYPTLNYRYIEDFKVALNSLIEKIPKSGVILITGSLAFVGVVRLYLQSGVIS